MPFFVKGEAAALGIDMIGCGHVDRTGHLGVSNPRTLDCFALVYLADHEGIFESRAQSKRSIRQGDTLLLFPGEWHRYGPVPGGRWNEYFFIYDGPAARLLQEQGAFKPAMPVVHTGKQPRMEKLFKEALVISGCGDAVEIRRLPGILFSILNEIQIRTPLPDAAPGRDIISAVAETVRAAPEKAWDFRVLAMDKGISYSLLRKRFTELYGLAPHRFLNRERMQAACGLLADGCTVKEACFRCGMDDPYHFSRLFRSVLGKSPKNFARSVHSWKRPDLK